mmetsp:Transcript_14644/g.46594  ORF Transcript_14644/g.46594 Transcript_14644/m.46594 type:complete len:331 (-) Transcript_14644:708-1700(-)
MVPHGGPRARPGGAHARGPAEQRSGRHHLPAPGHPRAPPDLLPHQQVHRVLPGHRRLLRRGPLPRGQPGGVHDGDLPLLVRRDVRGRRARRADVPGGELPTVKGEAVPQAESERDGGHGFLGALLHLPHVSVFHLRGLPLQRVLLHPHDPLWQVLLRVRHRPRRRGPVPHRHHDWPGHGGGRGALPLRGRPRVARHPHRAPIHQLGQDEDVHHPRSEPDDARDRHELLQPPLLPRLAQCLVRVRAPGSLPHVALRLPELPPDPQVGDGQHGGPLPRDDLHVPLARGRDVRGGQRHRGARVPGERALPGAGRVPGAPRAGRVRVRAVDAFP